MGNTILTNSGAIFIGASMAASREKLITAQSQLASGLKNPDPASDPSAISVAMEVIGQIGVAEVVLDVVAQAEAVLQLGVGILQSDADILNRLKELAVRSSSASLDNGSRAMLDAEFQQLLDQLNLNASTTWGDQVLFDGSYTNQQCQIGLQADQILTINFADLRTTAPSMNLSGSNVTSVVLASSALSNIVQALDYTLGQLAQVASYHARLQTVGDTMTVMSQNLQSVLSTYRDADVTLSLTEAQRQNTLVEAASAALQNNNRMSSILARLIQSSLNT